MIRDPDLWYSPDDLPDGRLHVRCWWMAHGTPRLLDAVRVWMSREKSYQWYTQTNRGDIVLIPPRGAEGDAWGDEPVCWQPISDAWTWPNGAEPVPVGVHVVPRMSSIGMRFSAVEDAAGEGDAESGDEAGPDVWWRDATQIRYERPGEMSPRMVEGRLMRALAHCGALNPRLHVTTTATLMAALADHADLAARAAEAHFARFVPLPQDLQDFTTAMAWFAALNPPDARGPRWRPWSLNRRQRVLHYRSMNRPISFADIGHEISSADQKRRGRPITRHRVMQIYAEAIASAHRVANRVPERDAAWTR